MVCYDHGRAPRHRQPTEPDGPCIAADVSKPPDLPRFSWAASGFISHFKKMSQDAAAKVFARLSKEYEVFVYSGPIENRTVRVMQNIADRLRSNERAAMLFLTTYGGDPHAAYWLIHSLRSCFTKTRLVLAGACKSAGTIVAIGADKIVFGSRGELGSLDVQVRQQDELYRWSSGLDIMQAVRSVTEQAEAAFCRYVERFSSMGITTLTASQMACDLAGRIFQPIAAQIDPLRIGESERGMQIANDYGKRLGASERLQERGLERLIGEYPSHATVIDMEEAKKSFKGVEAMTDDERMFAHEWRALVDSPSYPGICFSVREFYNQFAADTNHGTGGGNDADGATDDVGEDPEKDVDGELGGSQGAGGEDADSSPSEADTGDGSRADSP